MNFGSGAGAGEASGAAVASGAAKVEGWPKFGAGAAKANEASGWNKLALGAGAAEKSAATLRTGGWVPGTESCALAAHAAPSIKDITASCLFMILPSEVRPHAWNRPLCYGKQDHGTLSTSFRYQLQRKGSEIRTRPPLANGDVRFVGA